MSIEAMKQALEALENNRQTHHYCEDTWYSCPKHEDGCANDSEGDECNCGADKANAEIDAAITTLRQAIAEAEKQEPVAFASHGVVNWIADKQFQHEADLYTHPPKREWVGLTYQERCELWDETVKYSPSEVRIHDFAKDIEAKLKEKNT